MGQQIYMLMGHCWIPPLAGYLLPTALLAPRLGGLQTRPPLSSDLEEIVPRVATQVGRVWSGVGEGSQAPELPGRALHPQEATAFGKGWWGEFVLLTSWGVFLAILVSSRLQQPVDSAPRSSQPSYPER